MLDEFVRIYLMTKARVPSFEVVTRERNRMRCATAVADFRQARSPGPP